MTTGSSVSQFEDNGSNTFCDGGGESSATGSAEDTLWISAGVTSRSQSGTPLFTSIISDTELRGVFGSAGSASWPILRSQSVAPTGILIREVVVVGGGSGLGSDSGTSSFSDDEERL